MCEYMAGATNRPVKDYFRGMVFLTSTLTLPKSEAEQFMYFAEKGWYVSICNMTSAGGTAPVMLAGALALHLAQVTFANIADRIFYGGKGHGLYSGIAPYDMRTLMYAYGRPEIPIMGLMAADMARHYGVSCGVSCGASGGSTPYWPRQIVLYRQPQLWGVVADDAHCRGEMGMGWIMVAAAARTREAVVAAFLRGAFYASTGPSFYTIRVEEGDILRAVFSSVREVRVIGAVGTRLKVVHGHHLTAIEYALTGLEGAVRLEIEDGAGKIVWTNPITIY
ncbi:MAG: trimethylamine methyltransferase family protein [Planctomycetota bacterium]